MKTHAPAAGLPLALKPVANAPASWLAQEWGVIHALWKRDLLRLMRERSRWIGVVAQPLMFWLMIGAGMADSFRMPGAEEVGYLQYFYPGILSMIVLFTAIFATISVVEDRLAGFLQGVMTAPGSRTAMVLGKVAGVVTMALVQSALFLALAPLAGYPLTQIHWPLLLAAIVVSCSGLTALGFMMAWILPSTAAYHAVMSVVLFPLWILSGAMFPPPSNWMGGLMQFNPMTHMVVGVQSALHGRPALSALALSALFAAVMIGGAVVLVHRRPHGGAGG